ncbi:hypothetical protein J6590_027496 [Homalodisca vitripennis]|nr:hypothetical protein J6590_027496 [Homalodisca vitripennis]
MPRGECSALPRTVDTGVARYEAFPSHNVRAVLKGASLRAVRQVDTCAVCLAPYKTQFCTDSKHPEYYNKNKREDLWREISQSMNVSVKDLKKKMTLLESYRRERSREKKSQVTGSVANNLRVTANLTLVVIALHMYVSRFFTAGSINVIKCSKSCLDIRKKFGTSSSNLTSSRSLFPYSN